ncbi:MAG: 1-pyrroline-5-carboxylate dehydrogenase [Bacteroidetes bacterium HGW-Bacteroidetes-21]|nr:MAG: 1-pyrroline-5-carboxylate dehydrogenase [Bacteroidetes bacterium HGW-Bacteroidetes-21]
MNNAIFNYGYPDNEPVKDYKPGSKEKKDLLEAISKMKENIFDIPVIIGGKEIRTGKTSPIIMPHDHAVSLGQYHLASEADVQLAIETALEAHKQWSEVSWVERVSVMLKIAELIAGKYRYILNAATMLGQSKSVYQSEIDAVCETVDFIKFNSYYLNQIYQGQPHNAPATINRLEYRALEGFVYAISPFNFTSIAANLALAPALMGNTVLWKPSSTSVLSNFILMQIYKEAGLPDGVINFLPGSGSEISNIVLHHPMLAGIHFTGSTQVFKGLWKQTAQNLDIYRSYPRLVGETGGKDFIFVHNSAVPEEVATAMVRGAFENQGQKCSAASRAYIPKSLWPEIHALVEKMYHEIKMGDVEDFSNFVNAVIDQSAYDKIMYYIEEATKDPGTKILFGGKGDKSKGYFIEPTMILTDKHDSLTMSEEIFGPVLTIYLYEDEDFEKTMEICDQTSPYALTGSVFAIDRYALEQAKKTLKYAAGNFYLNDKPTGAVVGQQPFGGSRQSGTNDKAGSYLNLLRWTSPRTIKENLTPPANFIYPFMKKDSCTSSKT